MTLQASEYIAIDENGKKYKGTVHAFSVQDAVKKLKAKGLTAREIDGMEIGEDWEPPIPPTPPARQPTAQMPIQERYDRRRNVAVISHRLKIAEIWLRVFGLLFLLFGMIGSVGLFMNGLVPWAFATFISCAASAILYWTIAVWSKAMEQIVIDVHAMRNASCSTDE